MCVKVNVKVLANLFKEHKLVYSVAYNTCWQRVAIGKKRRFLFKYIPISIVSFISSIICFTMEPNGFPNRAYSLKRVLESPPELVVKARPRGDKYPRTYMIVKHLLLSILFLMVIWTLLKIPLSEQYLDAKIPTSLGEPDVQRIKTIVTVARVVVVILAFFGICGVIRESFSLSLVFSVFMFLRLVATIYVPYFYNGLVSYSLISVVTFLAFIFTALVRKSEPMGKVRQSDPLDNI